MSEWCQQRNQDLGEEIYSVGDYLSRTIVPPPEKPKKTTKPRVKRQCAEKPSPPAEAEIPSINRWEQELLEIVLGLNGNTLVTKNDFSPKNEGDLTLCQRLLNRGLLGYKRERYYLTTLGLTLLSQKRPINFGKLG